MSSMVMVHGAFCGGWAFERFRRPFEQAGWTVAAPDLPGHAATDPPDAVCGLSMRHYADAVADTCARQSAPPVLVGHSLGGLVALMAARRTPVRALVLFAPSAPWGVTGFSMEEAATAFGVQMLGPFPTGAMEPDADIMRRFSLDKVSKADARALIARMRRESAKALSETLNWWLDPFMTTSLGAGASAPSLVLVGDQDRVHPPATVRQTAARIGGDLRVLASKSHWPFLEAGWEAVADDVLSWLAGQERAAA
ncbi:alpha/beta fold hydrolase [Phenylobacterium deserti]|uniref:Alpha/beta hydrolase n=1 Tax=Phenylobacterium deserti TaxID=1914756 RepID=A0A328AR24_9CAUL|nr:alpha/beta hydrolase [Phenylobacterium deserti]RAK57039.1 alpha/beta hydrolase [Phenylobacterium deserti]